MNIGNRTPIPKQVKIKDKRVLSMYRYDFPYCEACHVFGQLDDCLNTPLELHHINIPGQARSDEIRNVIMLRKGHHERGTVHSLKYGAYAKYWNYKYLTIKCKKGEVSYNDLLEWNCLDEVMTYIVDIYKRESDKIIKLMGK